MTAEEIEKELRMLEIQYWEGDSMPRFEYDEKKAKLERRLEEINEQQGVIKG